jgi:molecular chaperone DnaK
MAADNKVLGNFDLTGLPPAPRGIPQIEVTFDIDANGIVSVQAKDKGTGKQQQIKISANGGLSDVEIQKMVREAETNAAADKKRRAFVEAKNHADGLVSELEKTLAEHGAAVPALEKTEAAAAIAAARAAMDSGDHDQLTQASERVAQAVIKVESTQTAHSQTHGAAGKAGGKPSSNADESVVDAEFVEVGDEKRSA